MHYSTRHRIAALGPVSGFSKQTYLRSSGDLAWFDRHYFLNQSFSSGGGGSDNGYSQCKITRSEPEASRMTRLETRTEESRTVASRRALKISTAK